jgi:hypothetical protein
LRVLETATFAHFPGSIADNAAFTERQRLIEHGPMSRLLRRRGALLNFP